MSALSTVGRPIASGPKADFADLTEGGRKVRLNSKM